MAKGGQQRIVSGGGGARRSSSWSPLFMVIGLVLLLWIAMPTVILLVVGLLPTLAAFIVDRSNQRYATFCVGAMNFSGVFPHLLDLWSGHNTVDAVMAQLTDVFALASMYGAAAVGWLMFLGVPPVVGAFLMVMAQRRIAARRTLQQQLIEEWGKEVASPGDSAIDYD